MTGLVRSCLVVDDSRVVRKVARRILENNGYVVEEAENGLDALQSCRACPSSIKRRPIGRRPQASRCDLLAPEWRIPRALEQPTQRLDSGT